MGSGSSTAGATNENVQLNKKNEEISQLKKRLVEAEANLKKSAVKHESDSQEQIIANQKLVDQLNSMRTRLRNAEQKIEAFKKGQEIVNMHHLQGQVNEGGTDTLIRRQEVCAEVDILSESAIDPQQSRKKNTEKTDNDIQLIGVAVGLSILFLTLDDAQKDLIIQAMYKQETYMNEIVISQGDDDAVFFAITKGNFDILVKNSAGEDETVCHMQPGDSFGELALMYNCLRTATVKSMTDGELWAIERTTFRGILKDTSQNKINECRSFLKSVPILSNLPEESLTKLTSAVDTFKYSPDDTIIRQGEEGTQFFIIKVGEVEVKKVVDNNEIVSVKTLHRGDYFGEMALLDDDPRAATVVALNEVETYSLNRHTFKKLLGPLQKIRESGEQRRSELKRMDSECKPSFARTDIKYENLKELTLLGAGAFGRVTLVQDVTTDETFALKALEMAKVVKLRQIQHVMNEKNIMMKVVHPFIQHLFTTFKDFKNLFMLIEVSLGGELFTLLRKNRRFNKQWSMFYAASVVLVFEFLHGLQIVYRDLKPENLLLDGQGYLKVIDFGFAKQLFGKKTFTLCGTPDYLAPEILKNIGHDKAVDWWALGILVYEMIAGRPPFESKDHMDTYKKILAGRVEFGPYFEKPEADLIRRLLNLDQSKRIGNLKDGAQDIKLHKWFENFDFDALLNQALRPPYKPKVKDVTDSSNFMVHPSLLHEDPAVVNESYIDLFPNF